MDSVSSSFRFGGLATGLDSQAIIDALMQVERIPVVRLESQKSRLTQQDGIFSKLGTKLAALKSAMDKLDSVAEIGTHSVTSSNEQVATATANGTTPAGTYAISVSSLAQAESRRTGGFSAITDNVGTGAISITVNGTAQTLSLTNPTNSLADIRDAINNSDAPVSAALINDGGAVNPWKLVVTSDESGAANAFSIDLTGFTAASPNFNFSAQLQAGQNAAFTVNGMPISRATNTVTDAVPGLSLTLKSFGPTATTNLSVNTDTKGIRDKVQGLVDAYNAIVTDIAPQNTVDAKGQTSAVLFGDSGLRNIISKLRSALEDDVGGTGSAYTTLASIGVRTGSDGKLSIDTEDFDKALSNDLQGVLQLFADSGEGVARHVKDAVTGLTDPVRGVIKARRDGIASRIRTIDDRISDLEDRLSRYEERLVGRFSTLETLVSSYQTQGASISSFR